MTPTVLYGAPLDRTNAFVAAVLTAAPAHDAAACLLLSLDEGCTWCTACRCHPPVECDEPDEPLDTNDRVPSPGRAPLRLP